MMMTSSEDSDIKSSIRINRKITPKDMMNLDEKFLLHRIEKKV